MASKRTANRNVPKELRDLQKFLQREGYTLAIPFDDIRLPGYIGTFKDDGQELIVDNGTCLSSVRQNKPGKVAVGNYSRMSRFSIKSFLNIFGNVLGIDLGLVKAKSVSITFPSPLLQTRYITEMDVEEALETMKSACKKRLLDPNNFVILQALETKSLEYRFQLGSSATADAKAHLNEKLAAAAKVGDVNVNIDWKSDTSLSIIVNSPLTIGYKTARSGLRTVSPQELIEMRKAKAVSP